MVLLLGVGWWVVKLSFNFCGVMLWFIALFGQNFLVGGCFGFFVGSCVKGMVVWVFWLELVWV
jgi:hypothetical protein